MNSLSHRTVLLTGASRGLGRFLARRFAGEGCDVVLVARDAAGLDAAAADVRALGRRAWPIPCDLADPVAVDALPARVREAAGQVHVIVHNAGIEPFARFETIAPDAIDRVLAVNLRTPTVLTHALLPDMLAAREGHVVFLGSTSSLFAAPYAALYGATKAAVAGLSRSLSAEYAGSGVGFSVVQPGFILDTGMFEDARAGSELDPPRSTLGGTTAQVVADAIIDAIQQDLPDVVVNSAPVGGGAAIARLSPRLGMAYVRRFVRPFMRDLVDHEATRGR